MLEFHNHFYEPSLLMISREALNPFVPAVAFNICCPRDCVSRHNGGTKGAPP